MSHYDKANWQAYKDGLVEEGQKAAMENHLYQCNLCLDLYLQTIDPAEIEQAKSMLPQDFGSRVMEGLRHLEKPKSKAANIKRPSASENTRFLLYYVAAASIAVLFTFNGFFDVFADKIPANIGGLPLAEAQLERGTPGGWSSNLMDKTISWVEVLIDNKEVTKR